MNVTTGSYIKLIQQRGFHFFLWTQFFGALNDNVYKIAVSMLAVRFDTSSSTLSLVGAVFILPFFLFSGYAGYLADRFNKRSVLIYTKSMEMATMLLGYFALISGRIEWMLAVLFLMALQSTLFSPAKYGILPEMLLDHDLSRANGLLEMSTFLAIILGTSLGSVLLAISKDQPMGIGLFLIAVALTGTATSFGIQRVPSSKTEKRFLMNPWSEVATGIAHLYRNRILWLTVLGMTYFWFLGALLQMDLILFGKEVLGVSDLWIGILGTFLAVGIGLGSLAAGRLSGDKVELGLVPLGSIGIGVFSVLLSFAGTSYGGSAAMLLFLGVSGGFFIVPLNALLQQKSEQAEKGRLIATANFINTGGILLASGILWAFRDGLGIQADQIILFWGLITFCVTVYLLKVVPDFLIRFTLWILTHTIYKIRHVGVESVPFHGPALLVANPVSHVDGLLISACVQRFIRLIIDTPIYEAKSFHWLFKRMEAIPVDPGNRRERIESLSRAQEELRQGHVVCIFLEEAITPTGNRLLFNQGDWIVEGLDVPIIPINFDGLKGSRFGFERGQCFSRWPKHIPSWVTVSFGKPLPATATNGEVP